MNTPIPTKEFADQLVDARKVISEKVTWKQETRGSRRLKATALSLDPRAKFTVTGYIGKKNYSFALLYRNYPIRRFTAHARHIFDNKLFTEPHKHVWDEVNEDGDAYIPEDINPEDDINNQFLAFCEECNINLVGGYQRVASM